MGNTYLNRWPVIIMACLLSTSSHANNSSNDRAYLLGQHLGMELAVTGLSKDAVDMIDLSSFRIFGNIIFLDSHSRVILPEIWRGVTSYRRTRINCELGKYTEQETGFYNSWLEQKDVYAKSTVDEVFNLGKEETIYCQFLSAYSDFKGTDLEKTQKFKEQFQSLNKELIKMAPSEAFAPLELLTKDAWSNIEKVMPTLKDNELTPLGKLMVKPTKN